MGEYQMEKISFGQKNIPGFIIGETLAPGIIFIQEWWGVTDIVKDQAKLLASRGFRVLIPDLYKGVIGLDREEASHLLTSLDYRLAIDEIREAAVHLLSTGSPKVGICGGCMGGALAFAAAQHVSELSAAVPLYGTPAREMPWIDVGKIRIPVSYHTGSLDRITGFSDHITARRIFQEVKLNNCDIELFIYEDTPHSFLNALTEDGIEFLIKWDYGVPPQEQVQLCFSRIIEFFKKHLE